MSAFDATLNVIATNLIVPDEEAKANGVNTLEVQIIIGQMLPFAQQGGQPIMAPIGSFKYALDRETAIQLFEQGLEAAKDLPIPSDLTIARDLGGVEQTAEQINAMRSNGS